MDSAGVGTFLGSAGSCPEIVYGGKTWKIGWPTGKAKTALEELVVAKATDETLALKKILPQEAYVEMFESFRNAVSAGDYKTGGSGWASVIFKGTNASLFLLALLKENHPEATPKDAHRLAVNEPERVQLAMARVVPGFFEMLLEDLELPPANREKIKAALEAAKALLQVSPPSPGVAT